MKDWYKEWFESAFYHKLYSEQHNNSSGKFIPGILAHLNPAKDAIMLDANCGEGRQTRLLSDKGYDVTGIDLSFKNILAAGKLQNERTHFYQHDLRLPAWINYFNYAFIFNNSFGHYHTRREHDDAMRTLSNCIKPGGMIIMDCLNVHYTEDHLVHNETKKVDGTEYKIHRWIDETHFYKKILVSDPSLDKPYEITEKMARFSLGDLTDMLSFQKMQVTEVFGDHELNSYHVRNTPRMIILARKPS